MKKFKTKGLKRRRILIAVGRARIRMNMVEVTTRDERQVPPRELEDIPVDRDQNLILEWWE